MAILVTGGAGFIGSHTCVELLNAGEDIVVMDNFYNSNSRALDGIRKITGKDFKFYEDDMLDIAAVDQIFAENDIEQVIHFAGYKCVPESVQKPLMYYSNNLRGTFNILETMKKYGCTKFVFSSSATVYGIPATVPVKEDFPLSAINPYGSTKLIIENLCREMYAADNTWTMILLRYFNPVGAHESGLIGEDPNGIPNNLMPIVLDKATGKRDVLAVAGNDYPTPDGTCVRDYIHVSDLADAHIAALKYLDRDERKYDVFNVGTGEGTSVRQIVDEVKKVTGLPFKETVMGRRAGDPPHLIGSPERINTEMGWHAKYDVEDIVESAWNAWQANPDHHIDVETWKQTD